MPAAVHHRRHTLNIDDDLLRRAADARPGATTTALVDMGLRALIEREAAERLAAMEGSAPHYVPPPRLSTERHGRRSGS